MHVHLNALHNVTTVQLELLQQAGSFTRFMNSAAPWLHPCSMFQLPDCTHFTCFSWCSWSPIASASAVHAALLCLLQLLLSGCVCFSYYSLVVSASAATLWLCLLQLLLSGCVCFSCCSLVVSASAATLWLCLLQLLLSGCIRLSYCFLVASTSVAAPLPLLLQLLLPNCVLF